MGVEDWINYLRVLRSGIRERNWAATRQMIRHPRFMCAVVWCYVNGLGTWCEWNCGLAGLSERYKRGELS